MKRVFCAPYLMLALALVGVGTAFYDAYSIYNSEALWCPPPINGCNEVANSPYAHIFNLPVGYFGVVYYASRRCSHLIRSRADCVSPRLHIPP